MKRLKILLIGQVLLLSLSVGALYAGEMVLYDESSLDSSVKIGPAGPPEKVESNFDTTTSYSGSESVRVNLKKVENLVWLGVGVIKWGEPWDVSSYISDPSAYLRFFIKREGATVVNEISLHFQFQRPPTGPNHVSKVTSLNWKKADKDGWLEVCIPLDPSLGIFSPSLEDLSNTGLDVIRFFTLIHADDPKVTFWIDKVGFSTPGGREKEKN